MKLFLLVCTLALFVGVFFHAEVGQFISSMAGGSGVGSAVQSTGSAGKSLFDSIGNSF